MVVVRDQPSVWVWLAPAVGVFITAMITLFVTNFRADRREWNKWRRDTLRELCSDVVAAARQVEALTQSVVVQRTDDLANADQVSASEALDRIGTITEQLSLIGVATYLTDTCVRMRDAGKVMNRTAGVVRSMERDSNPSARAIERARAMDERYKDHCSQLEAARKSFIERALIEIRSTSK